MKLPAASCGVSLEWNCAEALPAFALTNYGAVASPFYRAHALAKAGPRCSPVIEGQCTLAKANGEPPMADEYVDVIDEKDRITGLEPKEVVHLRGLRHRVAAVLLQRADGKYLIPTASRIKAEAGLLYHSAAGHVLSAESYVDAARRELLEETGLPADALEYLGSFWFEKEYCSRTEKERFHVYRATYRGSMGPVKLNEEQVDEQWLNHGELEAIYRKKRESISAPLLMTCKHIFGFENERKK